MNRRKPLALVFAVLAAAGVLVAYLLAARASSTAVEPIGATIPAPDRGPAIVEVALAEAHEPARATIEHEVEPAAPSEVDEPVEPAFESLTGIVRFADGAIPPPLVLVLEMRTPAGESAERQRVEGECRTRQVTRTDERGAFAIDGLCAGPFQPLFQTLGGVLFGEGTVAVPGRDVQLVLPGWGLFVDVVDTDGAPIAGATVRAEYAPDPGPEHGSRSRIQLSRTTPANGQAQFLLAEPSTVTLDAFVGTLVSEKLVVELRSARTRTVELVLAPASSRPELRIAITSCPPTAEPIADYCLTFDDDASGIRMFRVCSEDVGADGTIDTVRAGTYRVRAVPRYLGEPVLYRTSPEDRGVRLVVEDGRINELALCVTLGGRIALEVRERGVEAGATPAPAAIVSRIDERDGSTRYFDLREPVATGVTVSHVLPFGVERRSEAVLEEGEHVLRVTAEGFVAQDVRVHVRTGETTKALVLLDRAR